MHILYTTCTLFWLRSTCLSCQLTQVKRLIINSFLTIKPCSHVPIFSKILTPIKWVAWWLMKVFRRTNIDPILVCLNISIDCCRTHFFIGVNIGLNIGTCERGFTCWFLSLSLTSSCFQLNIFLHLYLLCILLVHARTTEISAIICCISHFSCKSDTFKYDFLSLFDAFSL